ncbi:MAG: PIN/TRAM domain-containing protein [Planctomycetia bacterium]|nr:PIN/TRAM domain-containing protein [Planctomycetia bacterium]
MLVFQHFQALNPDDTLQAWLAFSAVLGLGILIVITDILVRDKQITTVSALYFGLLLGLLLGNILSSALEPFIFDLDTARDNRSASIDVQIDPTTMKTIRLTPTPVGATQYGRNQVQQRALLNLLITMFCSYVSISTLLQTKDEFRFIIPYVEFSKQLKGPKPLLLDTSVIIDGRIADISNTRFLDTKLIVPRFVLQELQSVADSSDKLKRNRGRRGLDILKKLQTNNKIELVLHEGNLSELRDIHKVDERLVEMAKVLGARIITNDYNLNKIADLQGVEVINLNELSNALKPAALPGELMVVKLVKPGDQIGQGIGYLDDGTMVVVEQGRVAIGQDVPVIVTSVLQTPAGRMIFGRLDTKPTHSMPNV